MGVSFSAKAAIGVLIQRSQLYRKEQVPGCSCPVTIAGAKFCHQCGKPATASRKVAIDAYDENRDTVAGFPLVEGTYNEDNSGATWCVIASLTVRASGEEAPAKVVLTESWDALHARLKAALEPLGLWDEKAFGLWAIPNVSY